MQQPLKYIMKGQEDKDMKFEESLMYMDWNKHQEREIIKLTNISKIINS